MCLRDSVSQSLKQKAPKVHHGNARRKMGARTHVVLVRMADAIGLPQLPTETNDATVSSPPRSPDPVGRVGFCTQKRGYSSAFDLWASHKKMIVARSEGANVTRLAQPARECHGKAFSRNNHCIARHVRRMRRLFLIQGNFSQMGVINSENYGAW